MIGKLIFLVMISTTENHSTTTEDGTCKKKIKNFEKIAAGILENDLR